MEPAVSPMPEDAEIEVELLAKDTLLALVPRLSHIYADACHAGETLVVRGSVEQARALLGLEVPDFAVGQTQVLGWLCIGKQLVRVRVSRTA